MYTKTNAFSTAHLAIGVSLCAILTCIGFVPYLMNKVQIVNTALIVHLDEFGALEDNVWEQMRSLRGVASSQRPRRQAPPQCS